MTDQPEHVQPAPPSRGPWLGDLRIPRRWVAWAVGAGATYALVLGAIVDRSAP